MPSTTLTTLFTTALLLSPLISAYNPSACFASLGFPSFPESRSSISALTYDESAGKEELFAFQMEYDHAACEGGEKGIILTLNGPNVADIPCALTPYTTTSKTFFPSTSGLESLSGSTLIDFNCLMKNGDFIPGAQYTLTAEMDVPSSLELSRPYIFTSTVSEKFTLEPASSLNTETSSSTNIAESSKNPSPLSIYGPTPSDRHCPSTHSLCPVSRSSRKGKIEWMCMDMTMLTSCGGCPNILPWEEKSGKSKGRFEGEDCEVREGVEDVICHAEERRCIVRSCAAGYTLENNICVPRLLLTDTTTTPASELLGSLPGKIIDLAPLPATGIWGWMKSVEVITGLLKPAGVEFDRVRD